MSGESCATGTLARIIQFRSICVHQPVKIMPALPAAIWRLPKKSSPRARGIFCRTASCSRLPHLRATKWNHPTTCFMSKNWKLRAIS